MNLPQILAYLLVSVFIVSMFLFILSGPIVDWMYAREKRKKAAAAEAEGASGASPSHPAPSPV